MLVATHGIGATGGHFDPTDGFRDFLFGREPDFTDGIADGPDEIRKAVRFEVKNGADVIKAAVSGGVLSLADEVDTPQFTPAEMTALVDESHRLRKKVAVHCHGDQAATPEPNGWLTADRIAAMRLALLPMRPEVTGWADPTAYDGAVRQRDKRGGRNAKRRATR